MSFERTSAAKSVGCLWGEKDTERWVGGSYYELDTKRKYDKAETNITSLKLVDHGKVYDSGYDQAASSSIARLFGHDLPHTTAHRQYLLQSADDLPSGVNSSNISYTRGTISPLPFYYTGDFNGTSSVLHETIEDLLSTDSFLMGGWFRSTSLHTDEAIFMYGQKHADHIAAYFTNDGYLKLTIKQGNIEKSVSVASTKIRDLQWHYIGILYDKETDVAKLFVTNQQYELAIVEEIDISTLTFGFGSNSSNRMVIGAAYESGDFSNYFAGEVSNFQVYKWSDTVDYNVVEQIFKGSRESVSDGISISTTADQNKRLGQHFQLDGAVGAYTTALVNTDEGKYVLEFILHDHNEGGTLGIYIDNIYRGGINTYSSVDSNNLAVFLDDLELTKGYHFIKLELRESSLASGGNKIRLSQIRLLKQSGSNEGGSGDFLLLGDEFLNRDDNLSLGAGASQPWGNSLAHSTAGTVNDGSVAEAEIYAAKGLYELSYYFTRRNDGGKVEIIVNDIVASTVDTYKTPTIRSNTLFVRLLQGKNKIILRVNGKDSSSSGYRFTFNGLTLYQQDETSHTDYTSIKNFNDVKIASGTAGVTYGSSFEHGQMIYNGGADNKWLAKRWFAGGLYKVRVSYNKRIGGGNSRLTVDENTIDFNCAATTNSNNHSVEQVIVINPGYHFPEVKIISGSNSTFVNHIDFKLLSRGLFIDKPTIETDLDSFVKIGEYISPKDEYTADIAMGGIDFKHYSDFEFVIHGRVGNTGTSLSVRFNDVDASYGTTGLIKKTGTGLVEVGTHGSEIEVLSSTLTGAYTRGVHIKGSMSFHQHGTDRRLTGVAHASSSIVGYQSIGFEGGSGSLSFDGLQKFTLIATGYWRVGFHISVYGRKIQ